MKLQKYIFTGLSVMTLMLGACSDIGLGDEPAIPPSDDSVSGDSITVSLSVQMPGMTEVSTRALSGNPDYADMHLYLIEFADNGNPLKNTLTAIYEAQEESPAADRVNYKVKLASTSQPRTLHLIALPKGETLDIGYGIEASVIPGLKTENGVPAYWRRLSFPNGYVSVSADSNVTFNPDIEKLKNVALVRNFSEISMRSEAPDFTLEGFAIVNNPQQGTVAAWDTKDTEFPEYLDSDQKPLPYQTISGNYSGTVPDGLSFSNPDAGPEVGNDTSPAYMYERPFNSIHHTFIILKGRRASDSESSYYKLDIGKNDPNGIFRYYDILRNFKYNIIIKSVGVKGYSSPLEAAEGVVYNNFSFDIELSNMLNLSDGNEIVYVNFTTAILTDPFEQVIEFKYRYRDLSVQGPSYNNENVNLIGLEPGSVIKSVEKGTSDDKNGWRTVKITCRPAEAETRVQTFTIVKSSGLGRTVNLVLHKKWNFTNVKEFSGTHQNWPNSGSGIAGAAGKAELTIFFDIPDGLPEAVFPIVFTLESDRQNIENNPIGTLVVTSGPSFFSGVSGDRIKYLKTVTWTDYNEQLSLTDPNENGTKIKNPDGSTTHRVRCRFRTITSLTDLGMTSTTTRVRIHDDNFNTGEVTFIRNK